MGAQEKVSGGRRAAPGRWRRGRSQSSGARLQRHMHHGEGEPRTAETPRAVAKRGTNTHPWSQATHAPPPAGLIKGKRLRAPAPLQPPPAGRASGSSDSHQRPASAARSSILGSPGPAPRLAPLTAGTKFFPAPRGDTSR
ncbi:hypothetical protein KIL84_013979 [Mauremys mutica]|uniref:Uncharacterized protein n=1 Tax=Mauremys mutica TaxID=74926 RepID=A0A9D3WSD8_9SAUR|nr:hypothetical protein KIL84_013979 [Mauremys mutica]